MNFRIGHGYDVHRLESNEKFTIGGIEINHHKGVTGHSDADVVIHALCDAMLGALSLDDIGTHFPDTDKKYKNIDSKLLLGKVIELCNKKGFKLSNADITILLQEPKISKYKLTMIEVLSNFSREQAFLDLNPQFSHWVRNLSSPLNTANTH